MEKIREILYKMNIYYFIIIIFFIIINNLNEVSNENSKIYGNALILFLSCYWGYSIFKKNRREDLNNKVFKILVILGILLRIMYFFLNYDVITVPVGDPVGHYNFVQSFLKEHSLLRNYEYLHKFSYLLPYFFLLSYTTSIIKNFKISFLILNIIFEIISCKYLYKLNRNYDKEKAKWSIILYLLNPFDIAYFGIGLNIILVNMLIILVVYNLNILIIKRNITVCRKMKVILFLLLLNLTRPFSIIFIIALLLCELVINNNRSQKGKFKIIIILSVIYFIFNFFSSKILYNYYFKAPEVKKKIAWSIYTGLNFETMGTFSHSDSEEYDLILQKNNYDFSKTNDIIFNKAKERFFKYSLREKIKLIKGKFKNLTFVGTVPKETKNVYKNIIEKNNNISTFFFVYTLITLFFILKKSKIMLQEEKKNIDVYLIILFNGLITSFLLVEVMPRYFMPMLTVLLIYLTDKESNLTNKLKLKK